jgi:GNAT superfamily N-acetyltransferase
LSEQKQIDPARLEYHFAHPGDIPPDILERIEALILSTGQVKPDWLHHNLEHAFALAYVLDRGEVVGTEAFKRPRPPYVEHVMKETGLDLSGYLERGYVAVAPGYRNLGLGDRMAKGLLERWGDHKSFLVIAMDNKPPQVLTIKQGSLLVATYHSPAMGKEVGVWMLPHHLPPDFKKP